MAWERWLKGYGQDLSSRGFRPRSRETYLEAITAFVRFLERGSIAVPADLTRAVLEAYQAALFERPGVQGRRLTLATQARHLVAVRSFTAYLCRRGAVLVDPARDLAVPRLPRRLPRTILTRAEVTKFLRAIPTRTLLGVRDRAIYETFYSTGLRAAELIALVPADLDLAAGFVHVRKGKGGRSRVVPLGSVASTWIRRYLDQTQAIRSPGDALFLSANGRSMDRGQLSKNAREWAQRAGLTKRVTCHAFRHACATHLLQGRASLRHIQELLGHADPNSTQIYAQVTIQDLKRVHQRCHPRNRRE